MDLIHADSLRDEIGEIRNFRKYDAQIHSNCKLEDNTFQLQMAVGAWKRDPIMKDDYVYINGSEWGGIVSSVKKDTITDNAIIKGCLWRAMLAKAIIRPDDGQAYKVYNHIEANAFIAAVIGGKFASDFTVSTQDTGIFVDASFRYTTYLSGITSTLQKYGLSLSCEYDNILEKVVLSSRHIVDHSQEYDISPDLGIGMVTSVGRIDDYNHMIALGMGELENRTVLDLWLLDGKVYTEMPAGLIDADVRTVLFDYPNAESVEELQKFAVESLLQYSAQSSSAIDTERASIDLQLDDLITAIDRDLGIAATKTVSQRILTIDSSGVKIQTEVE